MNINLYDFCPDNCPFFKPYRKCLGRDARGDVFGVDTAVTIDCENAHMCRWLIENCKKEGSNDINSNT